MMLNRMGWNRNLPLGCGQIVEGWRAPWGCATGAPYRGTASPPPPPPPRESLLAHPEHALPAKSPTCTNPKSIPKS